MKNSFLLVAGMLLLMQVSKSQDNHEKPDSAITVKSIPVADCVPVLLQSIDTGMMKNKSILFIFNESLHPLGRTELRDSNKTVRYLNTPLRMNRCTLIYIDSGVHRFHTMYQMKDVAVLFEPGEIYMVVLTTRSTWPLPIILKRKDREGNEYGPVLWQYINAAQGASLFEDLRKKEVIVNTE